MAEQGLTYRAVGVDVEKAERFVETIKPLVRRTFRSGVLADIGGFGGLFALAHPDLAQEILDERLRVLLRDRPEVIATDCSGCLVHLRQGLGRLRSKVPVVSSGQLLAGKA